MTYAEIMESTSRPRELARNLRFLREFMAAVKKAVWKQGHFVIPGFVSFGVKTVKARAIRNPITGEKMQLPRQKAVKARASKDWRNRR